MILNPKAPGSAAAGLASIDAKGMTKLDAYTVRIPCNTPFATLDQALAIPGYSDIIPVGFNLAAPAGTGPFKVKSFSPGTQSTFVRYDGYWQTGSRTWTDRHHRLHRQTSQVNALLAGQVDAVNLLSEDVISEVQGECKNVLLSARRLEPVHHAGGHRAVQRRPRPPGPAAARRPPADARPGLRRLRTLGNDLFGIWAPDYDHSLPQRHQDIDQAKSLLKAAGPENLHVTLVTADIAQGAVWPRRCSPSRRRRPGSR